MLHRERGWWEGTERVGRGQRGGGFPSFKNMPEDASSAETARKPLEKRLPPRDTQRGRQKDRQRGRQKDRQTERQAERQTERQAERQTKRQKDRQTEKQAERQTDKQTHTERQIERQTQTKRRKCNAIGWSNSGRGTDILLYLPSPLPLFSWLHCFQFTVYCALKL